MSPTADTANLSESAAAPRPSRARQLLERADLRWLVFGLILLNTLSLKLNGGEEQYFAFAKAFVDPDWIPGARSLLDVPGSRIVFDAVVGRLLRVMSFEQLSLAGRVLCALLLAWPLARLMRQLQLSHLAALCLLQLCLQPHQSFIGKEWMVGAFEPKVLAYACVFASLSLRLERRLVASVVLAGGAVWFHVLVGGWYGIGLFAHLLLSREPPRRVLALGLLYAALLAPTAAYLAATYVAHNPNVVDGLVVSRIYVYFRNPHHLDLVSQLLRPGSAAQGGLLLSLLAAALCVRLLRHSRDDLLRQLSLFAIVLLALQFAALAIAPFDRDGLFLKTYPYRSSALVFLLTMLILGRLAAHPALRQALPAALRGRREDHGRPGRGAAAVPAIALVLLGLKVAVNVRDSMQELSPPPAHAARLAMYAWIRAQTPRGAVVLVLDRQAPLSFVRRSERDSYSVHKFVPTTNRLIHDWYLRVRERERALADPRHALTLAAAGQIDHVLSDGAIDEAGFRLVHAEPGNYLYAVGAGPGRAP